MILFALKSTLFPYTTLFRSVDGDGITDYGCPGGTDYWLNTTIPSTFPAPYAGRTVSVYIGPVQRPVDRGEDVARFYLDQDGSPAAGYSLGGIGADYLVEIRGTEGEVLSSTSMRFNGTDPGNWSWAPLGTAPSAHDQSRLEVDLPGVALTNLSRAFIQTRGWQDGGDDGGLLRPAFVSAYGLMYGLGGDPTGIVDLTTSGITPLPMQKSVFFDGTNFWAFYYSGTTIRYEPSSNGLDWITFANNAFTTSGMQRVSVWFYDAGASKYVYIVGDTGGGRTVSVRKGTISGTTISWGTEATVTVSGSNTFKRPFIARDSNGYLWILSTNKEAASDFRVAAVRSTNPDDVSAWGTYFNLMTTGVSTDWTQGKIAPLGGGDVYAIWYANGPIYGRLYTGGSWSGTTDTIDTTSSTVYLKGPSAVVDSSFKIHMGYTDTSGAVVYRQRTSSWSPLTTVDAGPGDQYPAISLDTGTGDVYAFWIASTYQIMAKKYRRGSWSTVTLETNTKTKYGLESIYNVSSAANMAWLWIQGPSGGDVKFSLLSSPFLSRTIDTDGSGFIFNYNYQRKIFYDGTYYWAFYGDGTNTVYTYSPDTYTWENTVINAFTTTGLDFVSVWYYDSGTTKTVYAVADSTTGHTAVNVRKGTISGTTITWGTEATVTVSATSFANKPAFITRDSNGYLWIASKSQPTSGNFNVAVVKSTNPDDVSAWASLATIADTSSTTGSVYATILPLSGGNMYAVWYQDGSINGKKYTGSWGSQESVTTTANKVPS